MTHQTHTATGSLIVLTSRLDRMGRIEASAFEGFTERHFFRMPLLSYSPAPTLSALLSDAASGAVIVLDHGLANREQLAMAGEFLARGKTMFFFWPEENAVEVINSEKFGSMKRHRYAYGIAVRLKALLERRRARTGAAASIPMPTVADAGAVHSVIEHMGKEAASLDAHLKGGLAELQRGVGATADQFSAHTNAVANQLKAALASLGDHPAKSALDASVTALGGVTATVDSLRAFGDNISGYLSSGMPVLERLRAQSDGAAADVLRIAAPVVQATAPIDHSTGPYLEGEVPSVQAFLRSIAEDARPVPFSFKKTPDEKNKLPGTGVYLRLDFWAPLISGGSYGHTCYQAQALAETTQDFACVVANRFDLLDDLNVRQVVVPGRDMTQTEVNILGMNRHYCERLGVMFDAMRPAYIFERAVLGSGVGAWASRRFNIPYIVEYNGSEISMKRSFAGEGYAHEDLLLLAEDAAFRQATLISVVSDHVASDVARRGIDERKILVNPNAVDLNAYSPASAEARKALRTELGFADGHRVVGFIGTFGGWHGIDVLAAAMPDLAKADPSIRFLLIGDGNLKGLVNDVIARHGLQDRVVDVGRVPQMKGAELLKACDILVSPHSRNMVDSPFFGSPTKLFEYMAMGVGIVASDLEQIGHVMSPALRTSDFAGSVPKVSNQRAVMCTPGDTDDFVAGVLALARNPSVSDALGKNAREAAEKYYTWRQHVRNLWLTLGGKTPEGYAVDRDIGTEG